MSRNKFFSGYTAVLLATATLLFSGAVAQSYTAAEYSTDETLPIGTVVALGDKGRVVRASTASKNYVGVVTGQAGSVVDVADSGLVPVLVSDDGNVIQSGDRLGVSDIAGVATKWQPGRAIIGIAKGPFLNWEKVESRTSTGDMRTVRIASIETQLLSNDGSATQANSYMTTVQVIAEGIAGRPVDMWRAMAALFIGLGGLILSFGLLFISSRESFFSIGRNPIASKVIIRSLWKMVAIALAVMGLSLGVAYMIVRVG